MDSGPVVVDISSDEEFDECRVDVSFDDILQLLEDGGEGVNNNIVDVDQYSNSVENSGLRPQCSVRDELDDDCMVLDGDPDKLVDVGDDKRNGGDDLQIVGQKGQVACRDFPHSRHLCANFPFSTTPHETHCKLCHCFVCDSPAPCMYWGSGVSLTDHCHATDRDDKWKAERSFKKIISPRNSNKHLFLPPVHSPQSIYHPLQVPLPIQTSREIPLRPTTTTTTTTTYQNHRRLVQTLPVHKEHNRNLAVPRRVSHTQFKKIGITGSAIRSSSLNRPQSTPSGPLQIHRHVLPRPPHSARALVGSQQRPLPLPRAQSMPITSERSSCTPISSEDDTIKRWRDILAGVAAELGVSDSISKSSTTSQPYTASSQPPSIYLPDSSNQGIEPRNDLGSTTITSDSLDFDPKWLDGATDQILPEQNTLLSSSEICGSAVCGDISMENFFTAAEGVVSAPERVIGALEVDPSSFLYDFEENWSSTGNV